MDKKNLAVFISGRGSNLLSIMKASEDADFPAKISVVVSNKPDAQGLELAEAAGIATESVDHTLFETREAFETEVLERLQHHKVDLVILAGFLRVLTPLFINAWNGSILNIHPSLLPEYKGLNTHARAIADGKKEAGCSVHYVVPELDSGKILVQRRVPILAGDTPETLAARVLEQEHIAYPLAIKEAVKNMK